MDTQTLLIGVVILILVSLLIFRTDKTKPGTLEHHSNSNSSNSSNSANSSNSSNSHSNSHSHSHPNSPDNAGSRIIRDVHQMLNQNLALKCTQIFGGDMKFIDRCRTQDGNYMVYTDGINDTFEILRQNNIDGIRWGANTYLASIVGNSGDVVCSAVYDGENERICKRLDDYEQRQLWHNYWELRRTNSRNWTLANANLQFR